MGLRLFVAVSLDRPTRDALDQALAPVRARGPAGLRWVAPDNWHFTLQFLGSARDDQAVALERALTEVAARHPSFELGLGGAGAFPSDRRARVVWVGTTTGADALARIASDVTLSTSTLGFAAEDRPYHPHLTVARLRRPAPVTRVLETLRVPEVTQAVREIVLYRSHLGQTGARYEALARCRLRD